MGLARIAHRRSALCSLSRCLTQSGVWSRGFASLPDPIGEEQTPINSKDGKVLHPELLNANFVGAEYAVRGELYLKGEELRKQGKEIIFTNVGNPHALGQKPRTFNRQVMSLVTCPSLLDHPKVTELYPGDVIARAKQCLSYFQGGLGAYTDSRGSEGVRKEVAEYIERRDGYPSSPDQIFLTDGASPAVRYMLNAAIRNDKDGILVPVPQYPLYSASIQLLGGKLLGYYLQEDSNWSMDIPSAKRTVAEARAQGIAVRGLVFINPGNPTGQCLSYDNLKDIIKFCHDEEIVLMADEVYQTNIYQDERPFVSCKKVMMDMGAPYDKHELLSFHTVSKGALGECGLRGGYVEATNIHPGTIDQIYKIASINLSPNTTGQLGMSLMVNPPNQGSESYDHFMRKEKSPVEPLRRRVQIMTDDFNLGMALMVNPPKEGSESYEQFMHEETSTMASLRRRAQIMTDGFNACEGVTCTFTEGAMYSFPRLRLPEKAAQAAQKQGKSPDTFYCLALLEDTGILTVPGSGFGQEEGTMHLRTTILPMEDKIKEVMDKFQSFHKKFMDQYR